MDERNPQPTPELGLHVLPVVLVDPPVRPPRRDELIQPHGAERTIRAAAMRCLARHSREGDNHLERLAVIPDLGHGPAWLQHAFVERGPVTREDERSPVVRMCIAWLAQQS